LTSNPRSQASLQNPVNYLSANQKSTALHRCSTWNITAILVTLPARYFQFSYPVHSSDDRRYNNPVNSPAHKTSHPRHHVYALETTGLLIMAATLLAITLVRYWNAMHWSLR
jgi:hypothetical protein